MTNFDAAQNILHQDGGIDLFVLSFTATHWPCVQKYLGTIQYSLIEAQKREMEEAATVTALASLSMVTAKRR